MYKRCCSDFFYMTPCFLGFLAEKFLKLLFVMIVNKKCARVLSLIENILKVLSGS